MLLIVSNKTDLATDYLILRLTERNIPFWRINTEDFLKEWEVDFHLGSDELKTTIRKGAKRLSTTEVTAAYIRQPKLPTLDVLESDKEFSNREIGETLKSLWRTIPDNIWLNAPHNILRASNKPEQLAVAQKLGLTIPNTCISSTTDVIRNFYDEQQHLIIAKAVKHGFLYDGTSAKIAATQPIDDSYFTQLDEFAHLPMIFQEKIEKEYDIRVTVIGEQVFATAIYSQAHDETSVDWRLADHFKITLKQKSIKLPKKIDELCKKITTSFNLKYSAIDMVKATNGKYYFLELNPNGQWAWLEQVAKHPIRDALIDNLTAKI